MKVDISLTIDEFSWLREAVDQMLDDIPHFYETQDAERLLRVGRGIHSKMESMEQVQVYTH